MVAARIAAALWNIGFIALFFYFLRRHRNVKRGVQNTAANLSVLKTGKAKAIRFSTLEKICEVLECQPGTSWNLTPAAHTGGYNSAAVRCALVLIFKNQCYTSILNVKFSWKFWSYLHPLPVSKMIQRIYFSQRLCKKSNPIPITPPLYWSLEMAWLRSFLGILGLTKIE